MEFSWVLVFDLEIFIKGVSHNFAEFAGVKASFLRVKGQISKFQGVLSKSIYILNPVWSFSVIAQYS